MSPTIRLTLILTVICSCLGTVSQTYANTMASVFDTETRNQQVLRVEAALAKAQAAHGVIPKSAALEIQSKADIQFAPAEDIAEEYKIVRHRMVALLNVWGRSMEGDAAQYVHFGATTVDIYDTVLVLQLLQAADELLARLDQFELVLIEKAQTHKSTVMMGRTLGQHALPITFGKKVSVWLGENRRNIERLKRVKMDLERSAILKGAVGSYLGLGEQAIEIEAAFAKALGLSVPFVSDWHGTRDVFADYAGTLALMSKSTSRIGRELFLLQMTDINETVETRSRTAVGSSTMPHKNNPSKSEALIQHGRSIPRLAEVVLDDVENYFERDNTSRPNRVLAQISIESDRMLQTAIQLIDELQVNEAVMRANMDRTNGLMLSQRLTFALSEKIGKQQANERLHDLAQLASQGNLSLEQAFQQSDMAELLTPIELSRLMEPTTYIGLAKEQTEHVIDAILDQREKEK